VSPPTMDVKAHNALMLFSFLQIFYLVVK